MCNIYLLTNKETLMPCNFEGIDEATGLALVTSPSGKTYNANPGHLVSLEDAAEMLRDRRAHKLVQDGYRIMHLRGERYRVWHPRRHGDTGGYIVTLGDVTSCSCPDAGKGHTCKHMRALPDLFLYALVEKPTVRMAASIAPIVTRRPVGSAWTVVSADDIERRVSAKLASRKAAA